MRNLQEHCQPWLLTEGKLGSDEGGRLSCKSWRGREWRGRGALLHIQYITVGESTSPTHRSVVCITIITPSTSMFVVVMSHRIVTVAFTIYIITDCTFTIAITIITTTSFAMQCRNLTSECALYTHAGKLR